MDDRGRLLEFEEKEHRYSSILKLKFRMAVILLANLDVRSGLVNGAQGTIIGFKKHSATSLSSKVDGKSQGDYADYKDEQIRRYAEQAGSPLWPEVEFSNGVRCVIHPDCSINEYGYEKPYTKLSRTQLPPDDCKIVLYTLV
ncbi:hypothetical protein M011DRAFT_45920 [Sporormia fimetaria CBS 119925]|uniref:DNA helicase Pif1-like 2B domain-containing protein n=1 Tax=Sporormia fimetaria CBS 119925 TaxID=1340428 RepID=A0A6A6VA71_9PLEO|nr:hypothetical protein M011DRAFT_45920 [Sporormia fimetaria CBS 119925]